MQDGIWKEWMKERVRNEIVEDTQIPLKFQGFAAFRVGLYFSTLSAFSIGWKEFNVGNWIKRMQRSEYNLRATGWARTVSGIQSLISIYLLVLWVLTYFGRPFD